MNNKPAAIVLGFISVGVLAFIDYLTGYDFGFFVFYFIPVLFVAWKADRTWALAVSVVSAAVWGYVDFKSGHHYSHPGFIFWNAGIRLVSFLILAVVVNMVHVLLRRQQELNTELSNSLTHIKQLKGFLPICASCKKIRNDKGYWEQIEQYISAHSNAEFTHGICPPCAKKLYGVSDNEIDKQETA